MVPLEGVWQLRKFNGLRLPTRRKHSIEFIRQFPNLLARDAASKSVLESVLASKIPAQWADATTDLVDAAKHGEGLIRHLTVRTFDAISRGPPMQQPCVSRHTTNHPATFALTAENSERSEEPHD
jgi:hypothetical protein